MTVRLSTGMREQILDDLRVALTDAVLYVYSGNQPEHADLAETGDLLAVITLDGGAFTPGSPTNGLDFDGTVQHEESGGFKVLSWIMKPVADTWKGLGLMDGTVGWARLYANLRVQGDSEVSLRIDGRASTAAGSDYVMSTAQVKSGVEISCSQLNLTLAYQ